MKSVLEQRQRKLSAKYLWEYRGSPEPDHVPKLWVFRQESAPAHKSKTTEQVCRTRHGNLESLK